MCKTDPAFEHIVASAKMFVLYDHSYEHAPGVFPFDTEAAADDYIAEFKACRGGGTHGWQLEKIAPSDLSDFHKECIVNWKP